MSLFRTKEWWKTQCGSNEEFDGQSLTVVSCFTKDQTDLIITGSHCGYLRIYNPSFQWSDDLQATSGYNSADLIMEIKISECIVDTKIGKFSSGSQEPRLAVLSANELIVYNISLTTDLAENGDRGTLTMLYKHSLPRFPLSLITGPFGGSSGRDFICIQFLDGLLAFYEQETHTFDRKLTGHLLAEYIEYIPRNDVFVTSTSDWNLQCYRYQNIAEIGRNTNKDTDKKSCNTVESDWSYNIGEQIIGIQSVMMSSFEIGIVVLSERHFFCFHGYCLNLKHVKKFDYTPVTFHAYVVEPDGKLMVLIVTDVKILLVYENTTLKWSAQLPFIPVKLSKINISNLDGAIIILSDSGELEVCYLGIEPSLFIAPPVASRSLQCEAMEKKLVNLRMIAKDFTNSESTHTATQPELYINVKILTNLECGLKKEIEPLNSSIICKIIIDFTSYTCLEDVQLYLRLGQPFELTQDYYSFPYLRDQHSLELLVYMKNNIIPVSANFYVMATYEANSELRIIEKTIQLPLKILLRPCHPANTALFSTIIKTQGSLVNFGQLFPELVTDSMKKSSNSFGICHINSSDKFIINIKSDINQYLIECNNVSSMALITEQILYRLTSQYPKNKYFIINQNNMQTLTSYIEVYFTNRLRLKKLKDEVVLLTVQMRNIKKRIIQSIQGQNSISSVPSDLIILMNSTYKLLLAQLDEHETIDMDQKHAVHNMQSSLLLLLLELASNNEDKEYFMLKSAFGFEPQISAELEWESIMDINLAVLLCIHSSVPNNQLLKLNWNQFKTTQDILRLKKKFIHAVERLKNVVNTVSNDIPKCKFIE